jgi:CDP-diglyceride synthetase
MDMPFAVAALVIEVWLLLLIANGAPVVAKRVLGSRLAYPLDGGRNFIDGQPLLGSSKTIRGIVASILATSIGALLLGYSIQTGILFATASLSGDLVSSFIKRRLKLPPSSKASGLDQLPESILPLLLCWQALGLNIPTAAAVILLFVVGEPVLSKLLFRLKIRDHPY